MNIQYHVYAFLSCELALVGLFVRPDGEPERVAENCSLPCSLKYDSSPGSPWAHVVGTFLHVAVPCLMLGGRMCGS